ncbi:MAG: 50S ribosomal protein L28 [Parcubacteria group bacterium CG08_land_8_20_14_0_20_48_21]|nr:MAG: 50S ribosomal protein L28 [Parcubacteria group bacterium CG08_land_8_20_14_0_20_48_21]PIW79485.1 MAG: 50S ribosomal protein L28 [Parcubacteria group bacterium CG_4_8_14_3_um_filter_48_16]PIY77916.1 MAG: 50S ribosomal protein L28 [Parcubacteria group bacterium CG_4_10_14_0_8_um_filter_48_154]PIZ77779.1 MAG: 50S ribosomal protein L28 [bacterium CG_4_10_14_0_2_um_filter_48_144]PJC39616.1 MAG: 50S ribosomal protein L28 [Parcubacteria group bacterium CG_4_9_14_0_2_um_filter_48_40]PJE52889.1
MAGRTCAVCGRGSLRAKSRSHSNIGTLRRQHINLQTKTIDGKKTKVCTSCLRNLQKAA